jgi:hypothetical protein
MLYLKTYIKKTLRSLLPSAADILLNFRALKNTDKSQFGEQELLLQCIQKNHALNWPKLYLEIGAAYPIFHSNSYALSKLKFRGVSYDANKMYLLQWRLFRRNDKFISRAVIASNNKNEIILHKYPSTHSSLSTTSNTQDTKWQSLYKVRSKEIVVKALGIETVYSDFIKFYNQIPTILMLDVEGIDEALLIKLLNNLEYEMYPRLILIECDESVMCRESLLSQYYELYGIAGLSLLLSLKQCDT